LTCSEINPKFDFMKSWITISWLMAAMVLTLLFTNSCQHCNDPTNPDCGNYNPCYGVDGKADFGCAPYLNENTDLLVKCDTLIAGSFLSWFGSNHYYQSYQWKVGSDTNIRQGKSFLIQFPNPVGTIPVTLIGQRKPRPDCLPGDDGVDTFTKQITIVDWKATALLGTYRGALTNNPNEIYDLQITLTDISLIDKIPDEIVIRNLKPNCDLILGIGSPGYKQFISESYYSPSGQCYFTVETLGQLNQSNDIITINMVTNIDWTTGKKEYITFIGKRQP